MQMSFVETTNSRLTANLSLRFPWQVKKFTSNGTDESLIDVGAWKKRRFCGRGDNGSNFSGV
jgi:hypothetical protein